MEGYQVLYDGLLSTVWSAPNYCYRCGNLASVLEVTTAQQRYFNTFTAAPENQVDTRAGGATLDSQVLPRAVENQYFM